MNAQRQKNEDISFSMSMSVFLVGFTLDFSDVSVCSTMAPPPRPPLAKGEGPVSFRRRLTKGQLKRFCKASGHKNTLLSPQGHGTRKATTEAALGILLLVVVSRRRVPRPQADLRRTTQWLVKPGYYMYIHIYIYLVHNTCLTTIMYKSSLPMRQHHHLYRDVLPLSSHVLTNFLSSYIHGEAKMFLPAHARNKEPPISPSTDQRCVYTFYSLFFYSCSTSAVLYTVLITFFYPFDPSSCAHSEHVSLQASSPT